MIIKYGSTIAQSGEVIIQRSHDKLNVTHGTPQELLIVDCGSEDRADRVLDMIAEDISANSSRLVDLDRLIHMAGVDTAAAGRQFSSRTRTAL